MVVWEQSKARLPALKEPVVHWVDRWTKDSNTIGHGLLSRGTFFQICLLRKISGDCFCKSSVGPWNNVFYLFCKSPRCGFQILDRYGNHILMGTLPPGSVLPGTGQSFSATCRVQGCGREASPDINWYVFGDHLNPCWVCSVILRSRKRGGRTLLPVGKDWELPRFTKF